MADHAGTDAHAAAKVHWKDASFQTWDETVAALREGITITFRCSTHDSTPARPARHRMAPRQTARPRVHRLRFNPDSTVVMLNHPEVEIQEWTRATEETMNALSDGSYQTMDCLNVALSFPGRLAPLSPHPLPRSRNPLFALTFGAKLRTLHTLVAWAQHPTALHTITPTLGKQTLRYGITPAVMAEYTDAGWALTKALPWMQWRIDLPTAQTWAQSGRSTSADAVRCAHGEIPHDAWTQAGFSASAALRWQSLDGTTVTEAQAWKALGFTPGEVRAAMTRRGAGGQPRMTLAEASEWVTAGFTPAEALRWKQCASRYASASPSTPPEVLAWKHAGVNAAHWASFYINTNGWSVRNHDPLVVGEWIRLVTFVRDTVPGTLPESDAMIASHAAMIARTGRTPAAVHAEAVHLISDGYTAYEVLAMLR